MSELTENEIDWMVLVTQLEDAETKADRRGKLMLEQDKKQKVCQFCYTRYHTEDCKWNNELKIIRKELNDEA